MKPPEKTGHASLKYTAGFLKNELTKHRENSPTEPKPRGNYVHYKGKYILTPGKCSDRIEMEG